MKKLSKEVKEALQRWLDEEKEFVEKFGEHPDAVTHENIVFSHKDLKQEPHYKDCNVCRDIVERERERNPIYKLWLEDPNYLDEYIKLCNEENEKVKVMSLEELEEYYSNCLSSQDIP